MVSPKIILCYLEGAARSEEEMAGRRVPRQIPSRREDLLHPFSRIPILKSEFVFYNASDAGYKIDRKGCQISTIFPPFPTFFN